MQRTLWLHTPTTYHHPLMDPTPAHSHSNNHRWQGAWPCILATLAVYICVSASLMYGYYGDSRLLLGPSSSRLLKASSVFVDRIEVTGGYSNDLLLYGFHEKPELCCQTNWTTSKFLAVSAYSRKGISLWLNKGSTIHMRWEAQASTVNQIEGIVIKGNRKLEKLKPEQTVLLDAIDFRQTANGKEAEYMVEEDDRYHIGIMNMNDRSIILTMNVNVSAKVYDTSKAKNVCSTVNGSCRLSLLFPVTNYVILAAPENGDDGGWIIEISFMARILAYVALLGLFVIVMFLILKCLGAWDGGHHNTNAIADPYATSNIIVAAQETTDTEPLTSLQPDQETHGIVKFHKEESDTSSISSEELYDEKLCVICYDEQRNCFFVPCGHCATCYECAQRIMDGESKVCPVCRRLIHKVRRLFFS